MSDEGGKFLPHKQGKFPALMMRAFSSQDQFAEWNLTPPEGGGFFEYRFEAKQENGILFINFDQSMMMPKAEQ